MMINSTPTATKEFNEMYNDADFMELVIKCLYRDKGVMQKALDLQLKPEDFGTIDIYQAYVEAALDIGEAPINSQLCLSKLKDPMKSRGITADNQPTVVLFWEFVYNDEPLNSAFVQDHLMEFIRFRRFQSLKVQNIMSPQTLVDDALKMMGELNLKNKANEIREFNPFQELVTIDFQETLLTGFVAVDMITRGLNYQEMGMIIGHSGSGKTAMAVYSAIQNAKQYKKVLYLSLEEPAENICSRVYSNIFRLNYTDLHKGSALVKQDLKQAFATMEPRDKEALLNLKVHELRTVTPVTPKYLERYLDDLFERTGWWPDLVYIDQLDYMSVEEKQDTDWLKYGKVSFGVDDLCNHLIGGKHPFSVWLLHQAAGKQTRKFSNAEVSGFKGVIKPADMVLAIGRDSPQDAIVSIFSIKTRHGKNFQLDYLAELEFMNFEHLDRAASARIKEEADDKEDKRKTARPGNFKNIPAKPMLLPQAGTGFMN